MLGCHWCLNLQEPHASHALANDYFGLVIDLDRERQDRREADRNLLRWKAWAVEDMQRHGRERVARQAKWLRDLSKKGTARV